MRSKASDLVVSLVGIALNLINLAFALPVLNQYSTITSSVALIIFVIFWALEFFRSKDIEQIKLESPPLDSVERRFIEFNELIKNKVQDWEFERNQRIFDKSAVYLSWQKILFWLGIISSFLTLVLLIFPVTL